jgi:hypothetical protein
MAFAGLHVVCASVGARADASLIINAAWSQTMTSAGTTAQAALPGVSNVFEIAAAADSWVAIGSAPDATQTISTGSSSARILVRAGETRNIFCNPGDKLAWIAA